LSATSADNGLPSIVVMGIDMSNGVVDEAGSFQLKELNGRLLFRVGAQGWYLKLVTLNGSDITDIPFDTKPSANVTRLEITLTDRQTSLSGSVKNSRGKTIEDYILATQTIAPLGACPAVDAVPSNDCYRFSPFDLSRQISVASHGRRGPPAISEHLNGGRPIPRHQS
jgi:hypothetical protein